LGESLYCSECGEEVSPEAKYCQNCGAEIESDSTDGSEKDDKDTPIWKKIGGIILGLGIIWIVGVIVSSMIPSGNKSILPKCGESTNLLEKTFRNSQYARMMKVSIVKIKNTKATGYEKDEFRECNSTLLLNNRKELNTQWKIKKDEGGSIMITADWGDKTNEKMGN
jgi:hypothetical protein